MEFTTAYILGVQRRSDYFGENVAQYRSVDTISIEGYIDVRASNEDYKGVRQAIAQIDTYVNAASNPAVTENIIINGTGFGTGRIVNLDFPASEAVDENQIRIGKYTADIEVYNTGDLGNVFENSTRAIENVSANALSDVFSKVNHNLLNGLELSITSWSMGGGPSFDTTYYVEVLSPDSFKLYEDPARTTVVNVTVDITNATLVLYNVVPFAQYLESFSEDFNVSLDQANTYTFSHNLDITYISGLEGGGTAIDPIATAKCLAVNLFEQTPTQFSTVIPASYGSISAVSRKYYNENYNLIDGSSSFEQTLKLLPSGLSTYSLSLSNSFEFDQGGIVKVSEDGEVEARSPDFRNEARKALDTEIAKSYDRCNTIYNSYKNYLGSNVGTLFNQPVVINKTLNDSAGTSSYSVEYTDDLKIKDLNTLVDRSLSLELSDNVYNVTENGTITSINTKGPNFDPYSLIPQRSDVKSRCVDFYNSAKQNPTSQYTLKNLNNKFTIPKYGKQISYTYSFTSDGEVFDITDDSVFARKSISHSDKIGVPNQSTMILPNFSSALIHLPDQTSLGTRSTKFEAQLRRPRFTSRLNSIAFPTSAINTAKTEALQDAYLVFSSYNGNLLLRSLDKSQIYVTNANYSFGSDSAFSMSIDSTFTMVRQAKGAEYNLAFQPN
mgnify:FL=1